MNVTREEVAVVYTALIHCQYGMKLKEHTLTELRHFAKKCRRWRLGEDERERRLAEKSLGNHLDVKA